jgi:hypothetical protein
LVDLDGDGILDLVSGSWPGEIYFFKGKGKGEFEAPVKLRDKNGKLVNPGGGVRKQKDGSVWVYGDATHEKTDKGSFVVYDGERIPVDESKGGFITGTASAVHAVDWDGDGKIDLLIGDIGGNVYLVPNEGTSKKWVFGKHHQLEAGGKPLHVPHGDAGPFAADWDGDGKLDLLVGAGDGSVWFYRNIGTAREPKLAEGVQLVPPGYQGGESPKDVQRGSRAKICVVDWNGDGRLDLLVGDFTSQKPDLPEPTPAQKAEHDKIRKEFEGVRAHHAELIQKILGPGRSKLSKEERETVEKELKQLSTKMQGLYAKLPREDEYHGWVWLFLRKPAEEKAGER